MSLEPAVRTECSLPVWFSGRSLASGECCCTCYHDLLPILHRLSRTKPLQGSPEVRHRRPPCIKALGEPRIAMLERSAILLQLRDPLLVIMRDLLARQACTQNGEGAGGRLVAEEIDEEVWTQAADEGRGHCTPTLIASAGCDAVGSR